MRLIINYKREKYFFILKVIIIIYIVFLILIKKSKIKVCICTYGKNENRYIREFIQHYEKYDVDKIYLYDNNDIKGEKFEDVIQDYIDKGFVEIFNWRGKTRGIYKIMNLCYQRTYKKYDWLIFYELDEFIYLHNYSK